MRTACILLSTYNGARFLETQMRSLLEQRGCAISILVRDDGSSDGTLALLEQYERQDSRVRLVRGANLGPAASFLELLHQSPDGHDGYFFCDQDDRWHEDKVSIALESLARGDVSRPRLYCSRLRYIDEMGTTLGLSPLSSCVGLANALVENVAIGCTMALNRAGRAAIGQAPRVSTIMHDWWCYLVISAIGEVLFDPTPHIDYRQHSANTVGAGITAVEIWRKRVRQRMKRPSHAVTRAEQARQLLELYAQEMNDSARRLVEDFVSGKHRLLPRLRLVLTGAVRRAGFLNQGVLSAQILLNDY